MRGGWRIFLQLNNCCVFHYSIIDEYRSLPSLPPVSQDHVELTKRITYISRIHMHTKAATAFVTFKNLCNIILNSLPVSNSSCKRPKKIAKQMQMHKVNEFERNAANKNYIFRKKIEFVRYEMKTPFSLFPVPHCNHFAGMLSNMRNHSRSESGNKVFQKIVAKKPISLRPFLLSSHISIRFRATNNFLHSSL